MKRSSRVMTLVLLVAIVVVGAIWYAALKEDRHGLLTVSFLDVGQGDAIFIDAPSGRQVLIDGGPSSGVLRRLAQVMPWYDWSIDIVVATHPDADHVSGLIDVLQHYSVDIVINSSVLGNTATWATLVDTERKKAKRNVIAKRGQIINLGSGAYIEILYPDRSVPNIDTNDGSIVARVVYGSTSFLLTGDAPQSVEKYLVSLDASKLGSTVLKAGHHGSKTASAPLFIGYVNPQYAVFSRGCNNKYGHPNQITVDNFKRFSIDIFDTCKQETVSFASDGKVILPQ